MALVGVVPREHPERLDNLTRSKARVIAVEDERMGAELDRSIQVGNFLHKTAVLSGLAFTCASFARGQQFFFRLVMPLGVICVGCAGFYDMLWQQDPLCQYQLDHTGDELVNIPTSELKPSTPYAVLVFRDNTARKVLHNTFAIITMAVATLRLWRL
eukprot:m.135060 g.135060  ORF g.135060 m.135060 type:complete len:157 (-) comp9524_c0_seq3:2627-3097(-)